MGYNNRTAPFEAVDGEEWNNEEEDINDLALTYNDKTYTVGEVEPAEYWNNKE